MLLSSALSLFSLLLKRLVSIASLVFHHLWQRKQGMNDVAVYDHELIAAIHNILPT